MAHRACIGSPSIHYQITVSFLLPYPRASRPAQIIKYTLNCGSDSNLNPSGSRSMPFVPRYVRIRWHAFHGSSSEHQLSALSFETL